MRTFTALMITLALAACGGESSEAPPAETDTAAEPMEVAETSLASLSGVWNLTAMIDGTPDPIAVRVDAGADGVWTMTLPDREPMVVDVTMEGDSVIMVVPDYESVIRDGVTVSTRTAAVVDGDDMMGTITATYRSDDGDEVVGGTMEGSREGM